MPKKTILVLILLSIGFSSCGRKGELEYVGERKQPSFSNVTDE
jgi:predicted small lipoprotein YifL